MPSSMILSLSGLVPVVSASTTAATSFGLLLGWVVFGLRL
jgi:hypothetical protein